jgi:hypothetical protein
MEDYDWFSDDFEDLRQFLDCDSAPQDVTTSTAVTIKTKKNKRENKMSIEDWNLAIEEVVRVMERAKANGQPILSRDITLEDFAIEPNQNRYTIKRDALKPCLIFPWFHFQINRFRQSLGKELRHGTTIKTVLEAMNYFFHLTFTDENIEMLRQFYSEMIIPISSHCLTTIVEVYILFREQQQLQLPPQSPPQQPPQIVGIKRASTPSPLPTPLSSPLPSPHTPFRSSPLALSEVPHLSLDSHEAGQEETLEVSLSKRPRTNEWAIQKNCELIEFYQAANLIKPHMFDELIENLLKANVALQVDDERLEKGGSPPPEDGEGNVKSGIVNGFAEMK